MQEYLIYIKQEIKRKIKLEPSKVILTDSKFIPLLKKEFSKENHNLNNNSNKCYYLILYTALYFALFYTRPEYEVYRKCANPNCNRLFKVKTTNSRKQYHNTACQNAAAQMRHRKLGK